MKKKIGLYDLSKEYEALYNMSNDIDFNEETGEVVDTSKEIESLFNELNVKVEDKLEATKYIINELEMKEKHLKEEGYRLLNKSKVFANKQEYLKSLMKLCIESSGLETIKTDKFTFSIRKVTKYVYDKISTAFLDEKFIKTKIELDKEAIKKAFKECKKIDGLEVYTESTLSIRS